MRLLPLPLGEAWGEGLRAHLPTFWNQSPAVAVEDRCAFAHHKSQPEGPALRAQYSLNLIRVNRGSLSPHPLSLSQRERDLECAGLDGALDLPKESIKEKFGTSTISQVGKGGLPPHL